MAESGEAENKEPSTNSNDSAKAQQPSRDQLVVTAIKFLQNPNVASRPLHQKKAFLQSKGLTEEEIERAVKDAGISEIQAPIFLPPPPPPVSVWIRLRKFSLFLTVVGGASYGLYSLYQNYIKRYLFEERENDLERLENKVSNIHSSTDKALQTISESLQAMQQSLKEILTATQNNQIFQKGKEFDNLQELKTEIASLKALMLSRRSFPPPPNLTSGLPSWQQQSSPPDNGNGSDSTSSDSVSAVEQEGNGRSWEVVNEETEEFQVKSSSSQSV